MSAEPADPTRGPEEAGGWHEELVQVGGRSLPYSAWEGEVLVRAAGLVAIWRGSSILLAVGAVSVYWGGLHSSADLVAVGRNLFCSCLMPYLPLLLVGAGILGRSRVARSMFLVMTSVWFLTVGVSAFGLSGGFGRGSGGNQVIQLLVLPLLVLPEAFCYYALQSRIGFAAFDPALHQVPLASLATLRGGRSVRAWAAYMMVWLTPISMLLLGLLLVATSR